jgi:DNA gyrase subunit A
MAIRFEEYYGPERSGSSLRPMRRNAAGSKGISLKKGDEVIGVAITDPDETRDQKRHECAAELDLTFKIIRIDAQSRFAIMRQSSIRFLEQRPLMGCK